MNDEGKKYTVVGRVNLVYTLYSRVCMHVLYMYSIGPPQTEGKVDCAEIWRGPPYES
jgi:hypothetical protein